MIDFIDPTKRFGDAVSDFPKSETEKSSQPLGSAAYTPYFCDVTAMPQRTWAYANAHRRRERSTMAFCTNCDRKLSAYSPGPLCGACAWEALARIGQPPPLPVQFWQQPAIRNAAANRDLQTLLRIYLDTTGLTQEAVALLIETDQGTISKIVRGQRKRFTIEDCEALRDGLHLPGHLLGLLPGPHELSDRVTVNAQSTGGLEDTTNRRSFNLTVLLTALGITTGPLHEALASDEPPRLIGMEHVDALWSAIEELERKDAQLGGGGLYDTAAALQQRAYGWLQRSTYTPAVGEALQAVVGELGALAAWTAFDAGRYPTARQAWQDTLLVARGTDDRQLETQVLSGMCLLSLRQGRPREALMLARTAERIAGGWGTPRLRALINLRVALGHAHLGNESGLTKSLTAARHEFAKGARPDDPLFVSFVTEQEMTGLAARSYAHLAKADPASVRYVKRLRRASDCFQTIIESPEPAWRRNSSLYATGLADARLLLGDVAGASEVGLGVIPDAAALRSGRIRQALRELRDEVARHTSATPRAQEFVSAHDAAFGRERQA